MGDLWSDFCILTGPFTKFMISHSFSQDDLKLIQVTAKCIVKQFPMQVGDIRELYYTGYMALMDAKAHFHAGQGAKFKTYASKCIYHAMLKEIGQIHTVVALPVKQQHQCSFVSFDDESCDTMLLDNQEFDKLNHMRREALYGAIDQLEPEDQELIRSRYGLNGESWTLKELGEARGVSLQAIHKKIDKIERGLLDSLFRQSA